MTKTLTDLSLLAAAILLVLLPGSSAGDAGVLYEVWHAKAATAMQQVAKLNGTQLNVEKVIRSMGNYTLDDVYNPYNLSGNDIYQVQPTLGYYCLYRARPNDINPPPDCPNITATATQHAKWLVQAGFDYIAADFTNWPQYESNSDYVVARPTEVLFEEWLALRQRGIPTPQIAVWPCSPAQSSGTFMWQYLLDTIYNNASYDALIYKQNGKKVVFVPDNPSCYDAGVEQQIRSNGGRNDVTTIRMWALFGPDSYKSGSWGFFSPCVSSEKANSYTTSMIDEPSCNQYESLNSSTGQPVAISASTSYMLSQCALPFAAPGHLRGLTIHRLFQKVLAARLPHLFVSSFNELIGGRQQPALGAKIAFNQGLPNDPQRYQVWVDSYGASFSRDFEPSVEGGDLMYQIMSSCVQLYKANQTCADAPDSACCTTADKYVWGNVWSLSLKDGSDNLLTNSAYERQDLLSHGWIENPIPIPGPTDFLVDTSEEDGRMSSFMLFNTSLPGTRPLYRCLSPQTKHFISIDPQCEQRGKAESILGYMATSPNNDTVRAIRRCKNAAGTVFFHALDLACDINDSAILGYVH